VPEIDRNALLNFIGYGNAKADVVFLGMEEGLSPSPPLAEQLAARSRFPAFIDLAESARVHADRFFATENPPIQPTWNTMIRILLALDGNPSPTLEQIRRYQRDRLGRTIERAALFELMPLPAPSIGAWPYDSIFPEYPTREHYRADQFSKRLALLRSHLSYGPKLIIAYGSSYWTNYKKLFPDLHAWSSAVPFEIGQTSATTVILTPHFTARQMNGQRNPLIRLALAAMNDLGRTS
jgi:hypothetical protein